MSKSTLFQKGSKGSGSPTFDSVDEETGELPGAPDEPEGVGHLISKPATFHKKGWKALAKTAFKGKGHKQEGFK